ncbi:hemerythrin domain-containing protein [Aliiroseovarius sp. S1123]|uniref:hemerythrin domain-containing protein n=1 Tax=unclassified Aliiroseovarius TaxID=2623558 RepID=UPI001FF5FBE7|nr:hemerythrin domain-containing protein [Aliiroseovarius sp. S1123]MCK0172473.1 hemerythrin domain-containing protein [Aliiroseovarius sp. S1123]
MSTLHDTPLADLTVDYGTRPTMPALPDATDVDRRMGRRLAAIHRMHLNDVGRIGIVLDRIEAGEASGKDLSEAVTSAEFAQNVRQFGSLCGRECKVLTFHHDAEEYSLFPQLTGKGNDALRAVIDRLMEEHKVVHELLVRLERAAMALMFEVDQTNFDDARAVFRQLETVVQSHFGYEETQLEEAIGVFKVGV